MIKKLINEFLSPEHIFAASKNQLQTIDKIKLKTIEQIRHYKKYHDSAKKELDLVLKKEFNIVTLTEPLYPALLKQIPDPPPILTYLGTLDNSSPCISMVGSRNATSYGLSTAKNLSFRLANKGFQVVSGLARGIDTMAHHGALQARGRTIAILGSGLSKIYPRENKSLFYAIAASGTVFSEFKTNAAPLPANFPIRNRIIAGISGGSVVIEAAKRSGSLITARLANEYNREVFAVPGSIKSKKSEGTHALLKQGAKLVETEMDIIDELYQFVHEKKNCSKATLFNDNSARSLERTKKDDYQLLKLLDPYPVHIDVLIEKSKMNYTQITAQLLDLELQGTITRHPGNLYSISEGNH
ncbi:MAG: DNA-processing protein DprA [Desulfobacula sp.]|nr:DNA-processing protein DprA [Desulfobacula sp.]